MRQFVPLHCSLWMPIWILTASNPLWILISRKYWRKKRWKGIAEGYGRPSLCDDGRTYPSRPGQYIPSNPAWNIIQSSCIFIQSIGWKYEYKQNIWLNTKWNIPRYAIWKKLPKHQRINTKQYWESRKMRNWLWSFFAYFICPLHFISNDLS